MDPVTLERAQAAKKTVGKLLERAGVEAAVGITRVNGLYAVKVNVSERSTPTPRIPNMVDGVPVKVEVVGVIRPR